MKRYCQTLTLKNDPELIEKYIEVHSHVWPEIIEGQHEVGIVSMQIYAKGAVLFMIVDTCDEFDWDRDMARRVLRLRRPQTRKTLQPYN